jgi:hypothetical protein
MMALKRHGKEDEPYSCPRKNATPSILREPFDQINFASEDSNISCNQKIIYKIVSKKETKALPLSA